MCVFPKGLKPTPARAPGFKKRFTIYGLGCDRYAILKEASDWLCLPDRAKIAAAQDDEEIIVDREDGRVTVTVKKA